MVVNSQASLTCARRHRAGDAMYLKNSVKYSFIWEMYEASGMWEKMRMRGGELLLERERKLPRGGGHSLRGREHSHNLRRPAAMQASRSARDAKLASAEASLLPAASKSLRPSAPEDWTNDECFVYFNPITSASLTHWLGAWNEALLRASEQFAIDMGRMPSDAPAMHGRIKP